MLRHVHFYMKGGKKTFAARCREGCFADFADLVPREPNGHFSNAALAAKSATGGVRTFAALENR